eukprot:Em0014g793a
MITAAVGRVASIVLSLLISCGRVTTSTSTRCFDAESPFQKQGCVCNDFEQYTFISCAFLNGELPTSMSLNYSYVSGLSIHGGTLTSLKRSNFNFFPSLTQLSIQNTLLQHIDPDAFKDVTLTSITLENSRLTEFPPVANLSRLHILSVKGNRISSITKANLLNTVSLLTLDLESNQITELPVDVFENTCLLATLSLSNNNIKEFRYGTSTVEILFRDLSFTPVEQLPTDGIRDHLSEINLKGATHFTYPSFTENDASHGNLTYPVLNKITMPFHTFCCQLRSQRIRPLQIKKSNSKRQGSLPQPTPSPSTSLNSIHSTSSLVSNCITSTVVQTTCRTQAVPLSPTVASAQLSTSATLMTFTALDGVTVISATPTPSFFTSTTTSFSSRASCSNLWTASGGQCISSTLLFAPTTTTSLPSEVVSYVLDISGTQDIAQSTASVIFVTPVAPSSLPIMTSPSVSDMPTVPNPATGTDLSFTTTSFLPTDSLSATPMVSCYTETVVEVCCNPPPVDCSDRCNNDPVDPVFCLTCYGSGCIDAYCLSTAGCICAAEQNSISAVVCTTVNSSLESPSSTAPSVHKTPVPPILTESCTNIVPTYESTNNEYIECIPEEDPFNPCEELLSDSIRVVIWIVITITLLGNGTVVTCMTAYGLFFRHKQKYLQVVNFLYLNLAAADFLMGVYLFTIGTEDLKTHYDYPGAFFTQSAAWQSSPGCNFAGFCAMTSISMSVFTLVLITLERVHSIVQVFEQRKMSMKLAALLMGAGWVFAVVMGALPIAHVSNYGKTAVCLPFDSSSAVSAGYVYFVLIATGVASLVIITSYIVIGCNVFCNRQKGYPANASKMNECYVAIRMSVIVLSNFACWFPIAVVGLGSATGQKWIGLDDAKVFMVVVFPLNASLNPIIYTLSTRVFRETLVMMGKKCHLADFSRHTSHLHSRETSTLRRLSLSKTSTTDLFASSSGSRSNVSLSDPAKIEATVGTTLGTTTIISLASIREEEFEDPQGLVIRNDVAARGSERYESVMETSPESTSMETSFAGIIENRAHSEE